MVINEQDPKYKISTIAQSLVSTNNSTTLGNFDPIYYRESLINDLDVLNTLKGYSDRYKDSPIYESVMSLLDARIEQTRRNIDIVDLYINNAYLDGIKQSKQRIRYNIDNVYDVLSKTILNDYLDISKKKFGEEYVNSVISDPKKIDAIHALGIDLALSPEDTARYNIALKYINSGILTQDEVASLLKVRRRYVDKDLASELAEIHATKSDYYTSIAEAKEAEEAAKAYTPYWGWRDGIRQGILNYAKSPKLAFVTAILDSFIDDIFGNLDRTAAGISYGLYKGNDVIDARGKYVIPGGIDVHKHL